MFAWVHPGRLARYGSLVGPGEAAPSLIAEHRAAWAALPRAAGRWQDQARPRNH